MKAKEAPEKLYITYKGYGVFDEDSTVERTKDSQTEYNRTDAFIEKACEYWYQYNQDVVSGFTVDVKDFRKYMEGE